MDSRQLELQLSKLQGMMGEGEVDDGVLRKKLGSSVVVADQDIIVVGAGSCYLTSRSSSSEVNTIKSLLYSDYIVQRRTYDLNGNKSEGHMGYMYIKSKTTYPI